MLYFFLSHAPGEDELYVRKFFDDLSEEVRSRVRADQNREVGYLDSIRWGDARWPVDANNALATAQTFIALYSAKYFLTERCGRSWGVFATRLRDHYYATGRRMGSLIPLVWAGEGLAEPPFDQADLEITPHRTPDNEDLRVLIRLQRFRLAYRQFVASVAHRVVETAHSDRLPASPRGTDVTTATDIFAVRAHQDQLAERRRQVFLVLATGTREQMSAVRTNLQFYGTRREDWAPFQPSFPQPLAAQARTIVTRRLLESEVVPIEGLAERLSAESHRSDIVVLLVDAWATRVEPLKHALKAISRRDDVAVLVPANREDEESTVYQGELRSAVLSVFPDRAGYRDLMFRVDIESAGTFDDDLSVALAEAQYRIDHGAHATRPLNERGSTRRPILEGP
ncbi:hypothetical protein Rhe02_50230 [Rhizocola hellebori]|uniref:TIR domain-containing protein n=1 Tax=Rhizocola hellebori TaxID=1392758 RepID=A0A8J3VID9_9ACTN|nr:FxsC protein [Rhizocola hellebori]GIH06956.1 hypothetical protein Rhe02_50230 [Rhizocola hellebori]